MKVGQRELGKLGVSAAGAVFEESVQVGEVVFGGAET